MHIRYFQQCLTYRKHYMLVIITIIIIKHQKSLLSMFLLYLLAYLPPFASILNCSFILFPSSIHSYLFYLSRSTNFCISTRQFQCLVSIAMLWWVPHIHSHAMMGATSFQVWASKSTRRCTWWQKVGMHTFFISLKCCPSISDILPFKLHHG